MDPNENEAEILRKFLLRTQGSQYPSPIPNTQNNPPNFNYPYYPPPQNIPNNPHFPFFPNPQSSPIIGNHQFSSMPPPYQYPMFQSPPTNPSINTSPMQSNEKAPATPMGSINESEDPPFCTEDGLDTIDLDFEGGSAPVMRKTRDKFEVEEDKLFVRSYLNVSEDSIQGNDQKSKSFWKKVEVQYNKFLNKNTKRKTMDQLKKRYSRILPRTSKFVGCYQHAVSYKPSGSNDADTMERAHAIYEQDQGEKFTLEHVWQLVKDHPRWLTPPGTLKGASSKRTKNDASGAYTSSSNPPTPSSEDIPQSPIIQQSPIIERPIGQKAAKRKGKSSSDSNKVDAFNDFKRDYMIMEMQKMELEKQKMAMEMEKEKQKMDIKAGKMTMEMEKEKQKRDMEKQKMLMEKQKMEIEAEKLRISELEILCKDTTGMTEIQKQAHQMVCSHILKKHNIQ